jgi:hypothetical protein
MNSGGKTDQTSNIYCSNLQFAKIDEQGIEMKHLFTASVIALAVLAPASLPAQAARTSISFAMVVSTGAKTCLPKATAHVIDASLGPVEELTVVVSGLPPNTDFDFFSIQVPNAPFGLAWYNGDIETDGRGIGVGHFTARYNVETFIVSPGAVPAPQVFTKPPFPDANQGVKVGPVQLYHLGLWFNSPADAAKAGCANTVTPFNGEHNAGIQVLNTSSFQT